MYWHKTLLSGFRNSYWLNLWVLQHCGCQCVTGCGVCACVWVCLCVGVDSLLPRPQSCSPQSSYYYWAVDHFSAVDPWGDASVTPLQPKSIFLFIHHRFAPFLLFPPMLTLFLPHEACKCSMRQRFCQLITILTHLFHVSCISCQAFSLYLLFSKLQRITFISLCLATLSW